MDTYEASENFVRSYLEEAAITLCKLGDKGLDDRDTQTLASLLCVIEYVSVGDHFETFLEENKEAIAKALNQHSFVKNMGNKLVINDIKENADGSANIDAIVGDTMRHHLIGEGLNFVLLKTVLETSSTDQILKWAIRGKQEEKVDDIVEKFSSIYNEDTK